MSNTPFTFYLDAPEYVAHATGAPVIAVQAEVEGYFPIHTRAVAADLNQEPLPLDVAESALSASMFGWDTPAAKAALDYAEAHSNS